MRPKNKKRPDPRRLTCPDEESPELGSELGAKGVSGGVARTSPAEPLSPEGAEGAWCAKWRGVRLAQGEGGPAPGESAGAAGARSRQALRTCRESGHLTA